MLTKYDKWLEEIIKGPGAQYQVEIANELIPISRWYRECIRNGEAIEGVWMLLPALYAQVGKTNYRDESLTHLTNVLGKWPLAYRKMYQRNRTINLDGRQGKQLAGDEWVENHLAAPVKRYANAQTRGGKYSGPWDQWSQKIFYADRKKKGKEGKGGKKKKKGKKEKEKKKKGRTEKE